jgi:glutamate dehydrogenase (NAD(P)+)
MVTAAVRYRESPLDTASWNFSSACGRLALEPDLKALLAMPYRELSMQLPVRMDDGTLRVFRASRVLHSNTRGPAAGSIRIAPGANSDLAFALANIATWTATLMNVPFGGASGAIDCERRALTDSEYESLIRRFASRSHIALGPFQDVAISTTEVEAALLLDEYSSLHGLTPACVTGKSPDRGGVANGPKAQSQAAAIALREVAARFGRELKDLRVAVYSTPETISDYLAEFALSGCQVVAISDGRNTASDSEGLTPAATITTSDETSKSADSVLFADCDVLVLASSECILNAANAARVRARIIVEATPLGITPSADVTLRQQRSVVIPDVIAASGATIAAYVEWSANLEHKQPRDLDAALAKAIPKAVETVFDRLNQDHSSLRSAAYCVAIERVARTERLRGI